MKRIVLTFCILALGTGAACRSWADDLAMAAILPVTTHTILGGMVKTVTYADPVKGTKSEIVVIDTAKKSNHILITPTTTLWDKDAKAIMLDKIISRSRVNVIYLTTDEGINIGKSIKVLK